MCGIVGFNWNDTYLVKKMTNSLKHRGPDGFGYYVDNFISLGHRRLAILDLSKNGKQPMSNNEGNIWVVFNGEIYNFRELRKELEELGYRFKSNTDTEVIIHAYQEYGFNCVKKFRGMFAFAIWDTEKKIFFLARDPMGVKPLYYFWDNSKFIFASEMSAIFQFKGFDPEIDLSSLSQLLRFRYVPFSNTLLKKIYKIPPATCLVFSRGKINLFRYKEFLENAPFDEKSLSLNLYKEISRSVRDHLVSDVPVGVFLSGGIDSSIISSLASTYNANLTAFTVDFDNFSESKYARKVTEYLGMPHYVYNIGQREAVNFLNKLGSIVDEPIIDPAMIPNYALSSFAKRKNFKVLLSGDGADEIFGGYDYYQKILQLARISHHLRFFNQVFRTLAPSGISDYSRIYNPADAYLFLNKAFKDRDIMSLMNFKFDYNLCRNTFLLDLNKKFNFYLDKILYLDLRYQLAEYFLMKTDKSSMASSVEVRVPYVTTNIIDFSFKIDPVMKFKVAKNLLRNLSLSFKLLPTEIAMRKKQGYGVPISSWFSGTMGEMIKNQLDDSLLVRDGIFSSTFMKKIIPKINKNSRYSNMSWMLYSLDRWYEKYFS